MLVIGLTGNMGTGKTTVSQILARLGAAVIDADKLGHELLQPHTPTWYQVVAAFGRDILQLDDQIDRHRLSQIVFADTESLARLNQLMHPKMYDLAKERLESLRNQGANAVVLEAPLLIEAGWKDLVDQVWVTTAPKAVVSKRLQENKGLAEADILARLHIQMPQQEKIKQADVVIDTSCSLAELEAKVKELWQKVLLLT